MAVTETGLVGGHQRRQVLAALAADRVVGVPGAGGYALAARLDSVAALVALHHALDLEPEEAPKPAAGRTAGRLVLVGRRRDAQALASEWSPATEQLTEGVWPGPVVVEVTPAAHVLFGAGAGATDDLDGDDGSLGLTMPRWRPLRLICRQSGPLAVVPVRRSDGSLCLTAEDLRAHVRPSAVSLVLNAGTCRGPGPTVVDCRISPPVVRRVGELPEAYVEGVLLMAAGRRKRFGFFTFGRPVSS